MIRSILVPRTTELSSGALLDAALAVATQLNGHVRALFVLPNPDAAFAYVPDVVLAAGVTREVLEREMLETRAAAKDSFLAWRKRNKIPEAPDVRLDSCFATWSGTIWRYRNNRRPVRPCQRFDRGAAAFQFCSGAALF
jgi:hypothetical protein